MEAHALVRKWKSGVEQGSRCCHGQLTGWKGKWTGRVRVLTVGRIQFGSMIRPSVGGAEDGPSLFGLTENTLGLRRVGGPSPQILSEGATSKGAGVGGVGPVDGSKGSKGKRRPDRCSINKGPMGILAQLGPYGEANFELEFLSTWEKEAERVQQVDFHYLLTDSALVEEVSRYGSLSNLGGLRDSGTPSHSFLFSLGRTPEGEFFDHSEVLREACQNGIVSNCQDAAGPSENGNDRWELVEFNALSQCKGFGGGGVILG
ncbi:hypothetical protein CK203_086254 [Vitis vinifera]|uniref:Uncharacterized protein n=1 Tax=Vitis vinifera TaxID=29760 RepID=A0A438EDC6_VITVI|nr:hypothetical protein CK203_086254 [Vitis vinifera]